MKSRFRSELPFEEYIEREVESYPQGALLGVVSRLLEVLTVNELIHPSELNYIIHGYNTEDFVVSEENWRDE